MVAKVYWKEILGFPTYEKKCQASSVILPIEISQQPSEKSLPFLVWGFGKWAEERGEPVEISAIEMAELRFS